jgi:hypothetical protein
MRRKQNNEQPNYFSRHKQAGLYGRGGEVKVYRIQAADGRGPFRPGLTKYWIDVLHAPRPMPIQDAFGFFWIEELRAGWMYGCGCLSLDELVKWFSPNECAALKDMGYFPAVIEADEIVRNREGEQVIFGCKKPFSKIAKKLTWDALLFSTEPTAELAEKERK